MPNPIARNGNAKGQQRRRGFRCKFRAQTRNPGFPVQYLWFAGASATVTRSVWLSPERPSTSACLPATGKGEDERGRLTAAAVKGRLLSDVRVKLNMIFQCCICGPMKKNEFVLEEKKEGRGGDRSRRDSASIVGKCNNSSSAATRRMRSKRRNRSALQWRHYSCIAASLSSPRCGSSD